MNIFLDYHSRVPIYEQIEEQIVLDVSRGVLKPNEQLPSLRQLSSELGLNINTVKRALSNLETKGITYSVAGKGIFISEKKNTREAYAREAVENVQRAVTNAKDLGVGRDEMIGIIKQIYNKGVDESD